MRLNYDNLTATIVETYDSGNLVNTEFAVLGFELNQTKSKNGIASFGFDLSQTNDLVEINNKSNSYFELKFHHHGVYELRPFAIDKMGNKNSIDLSVVIDLEINWFENSTSTPTPLSIDPTPANNDYRAKYMKIESSIENPRNLTEIGGGQSVQFSWSITDEYDDTCQSKDGNVADGEIASWETIYFNTMLIHDLNVEYKEGQDYLDIYHKVSLFYDQ